MKNIIISLTAILLITMLSSCKKDEPVPQTYFGFENYEEAAANLGIHIHYFDVVEGGIHMQSTKQMNSDRLNWQLGASFRSDIFSDFSEGGIYYLNDNKFIYNGTSYRLDGGDRLDNEGKEAVAAPMYGQNNTFRLERDEEDVFSIEYYVPEFIEVLNIQGNLMEIGKGSGLNLEWNADSNNDHGVVIHLVWNGLNMSDNSSSQELYRAVRVDDTGNTTLDSNFFNELPVGADFSLYVIRGNAARKDADDNRSYTMLSHTAHRISCQIVE